MLITDVPQQVTRIKPSITRFENVSEDLVFRLPIIGVSDKGCFLADPADQQTGLTLSYRLKEAFIISDRHAIAHVIFDNGIDRGAISYGTIQIQDVRKSDISFRRSVEFIDFRNSKAGFEGFPDIGTKTVSDDFLDRVFRIHDIFRLQHKIST